MEVLLLFSGLLVAIYVYTTLAKRRGRAETEQKGKVYHYQRNAYLMRKDEYYFFRELVEVVGQNYLVFPQVHLPSVIDHKVKGQSWKPAFRHIQGKSVDYVICTKVGVRPVLAIELDGSSHNNEAAKAKDTEKDRIFAEADIPLLRFPNPTRHTEEELSAKILPLLHD